MIRTRVELPNFTPKRLVEESVLAYNLRHLEQLDSDTTPWPVLTSAILAHLRHGWTDNDEQLSAGYDPALRDALAKRAEKAAFQRYPWLKKDPRPFTAPTVTQLAFDKAATYLTSLYGQVDQVNLAIRDLRRLPSTPETRKRIRDLSEVLTGMRDVIAEHNRLFAPTEPDTVGSYIAVRPPEKFGEYRFNGRSLAMNYLDFAGYRCPNCDYQILRTKRPINFGQGRKLNAHSCGCLSYAVDPPPPGHDYGFKIDLTLWTEMIDSTYKTNQESISKTYEHASQ